MFNKRSFVHVLLAIVVLCSYLAALPSLVSAQDTPKFVNSPSKRLFARGNRWEPHWAGT